ncbi:NAD-dependent epimerase/dehydratase family protein [Shinella sp. PSBB067]|uniref:dTDP-glucose 4,6-dehydratase n=1 Tax=Shinella sp. PSBB067 TaxID=2715959 RepID=UPI00193C358D|nr:NAD-dependent epimerase/dehydratase family protein [Shinella sp. PSBB067]QRI64151.1 NAD-dependent epimerase/dehydratase family protein [Shinella sp. PSBB067]
MASLALDRIRTIVVTGGAGFVGSHIVDDLLVHCPEARIRVLDAFTYAADMSHLDAAFRTGRVTIQQGDVGNLDLVTEMLRDADLVVHAAGESHVERAFSVPERFTVANALGTQVLVEAMGRRRVPLMIHVGTAEVYGAGTGEPAGERAPLLPDNPYGASKAAAEMLIAGLRRSFGLDIRVLRPVNIVGTRQNAEKLLPRFLEMAAVGRPLPVHGDGLQMRAFVTMADFCSALRTVVTHGAENATYNVAGDDLYDILSVARMVLDAVQDPVAGVTFTGGRPDNASRPPVDTAALRALGWQPKGTLRGELPALAAWYAARVPGGTRRRLRQVPGLAPQRVQAVTQAAGSGLFRSLERH